VYENVFIPLLVLVMVALLGVIVGLGLSDTRRNP
jgi:hypothetical protein